MASYWDEDLAILSAENVSFALETAGLGSRFAALALDTFLQILVAALLGLSVAGFDNYIAPTNELPRWLGSTLTALLIFAFFALFFGYYFVFEWLWDGQTPGKRFFGLRVMLANGLPLTVSAAAARNAVRLVDSLPFAYGFGAFVGLSNALNQRMGDLAAGTIVVREAKLEKQRQPLSIDQAVEAFLHVATTVPGQAAAPAPFEDDEELRVETARAASAEAAALSRTLSREDYELVRGFWARRETLPPATRDRLARSLTARLAAKMGQEAPANAEAFLETTLAQLGGVYA